MDANTGKIYAEDELRKLTDNQLSEMDLMPLSEGRTWEILR